MRFEIGDKVIYPNHGLGVVERIETKTIFDTTCGFYCLRMSANLSTVMVPLDNVEGIGLRRIKGGILVDIGVPAFLPASQIDVRRPTDVGQFMGKIVRAEILKIDEPRRNIVISRRTLLENERTKRRTSNF